MKNIIKFMMISLMMTIGSLNAFGGNLMGSDPDTYTPGPATKNNYILTIDSLAPNELSTNIDEMYGKYYPELKTLTLKNKSTDKLMYKFEQVTITFNQNDTAPSGTELIGTFVSPNQGASFAQTTIYAYGVLVK